MKRFTVRGLLPTPAIFILIFTLAVNVVAWGWRGFILIPLWIAAYFLGAAYHKMMIRKAFGRCDHGVWMGNHCYTCEKDEV